MFTLETTRSLSRALRLHQAPVRPHQGHDGTKNGIDEKKTALMTKQIVIHAIVSSVTDFVAEKEMMAAVIFFPVSHLGC